MFLQRRYNTNDKQTHENIFFGERSIQDIVCTEQYTVFILGPITYPMTVTSQIRIGYYVCLQKRKVPSLQNLSHNTNIQKPTKLTSLYIWEKYPSMVNEDLKQNLK